MKELKHPQSQAKLQLAWLYTGRIKYHNLTELIINRASLGLAQVSYLCVGNVGSTAQIIQILGEYKYIMY